MRFVSPRRYKRSTPLTLIKGRVSFTIILHSVVQIGWVIVRSLFKTSYSIQMA